MEVLVFDIGGTKIRAGIFDTTSAALIRSAVAATPNHLHFREESFGELSARLLSEMHRLANEIVDCQSVRQISVAFAGPIDPSGGVLAAPTIWGPPPARPYALGKEMALRWPNARIKVMNDVTAAGYRYCRPQDDDFCIVTVSSGIGNKVFSRGRPLVGRNGRGGEIGYLRVDDSKTAPLCECGGRGHLGAISSGRGALETARRHAPDGASADALTSGDLAAAFRRKECWAVAVIAQGAGPLGWALAAMHLGLGIERFVLVGGFALALGDAYRQLVAEAAGARSWGSPGAWESRVELGENDDWSGLIGAGIAEMRRSEPL